MQPSAGKHFWSGFALDATGQFVVGCYLGGNISTSTNFGASWQQQPQAGARNWVGVASSSNGNKLAAIVQVGYVYTSSDSGVTWSACTSLGSKSLATIASDTTGNTLVVGVGGWVSFGGQQIFGYIYVSTDAGTVLATRDVMVVPSRFLYAKMICCS
jgi:hypothetical protein